MNNASKLIPKKPNKEKELETSMENFRIGSEKKKRFNDKLKAEGYKKSEFFRDVVDAYLSKK